jgi:hypothetical protein
MNLRDIKKQDLVTKNNILKKKNEELRKKLADQVEINRIHGRINQLMMIQAGPVYSAYRNSLCKDETMGKTYADCMRWAGKRLGVKPIARGDKLLGVEVGDYWVGVEF